MLLVINIFNIYYSRYLLNGNIVIKHKFSINETYNIV